MEPALKNGKQILRQVYRNKRQGISLKEKAQLEVSLLNNIQKVIDKAKYIRPVVAMYYPIASEIDCLGLFTSYGDSIIGALPVVVEKDA